MRLQFWTKFLLCEMRRKLKLTQQQIANEALLSVSTIEKSESRESGKSPFVPNFRTNTAIKLQNLFDSKQAVVEVYLPEIPRELITNEYFFSEPSGVQKFGQNIASRKRPMLMTASPAPAENVLLAAYHDASASEYISYIKSLAKPKRLEHFKIEKSDWQDLPGNFALLNGTKQENIVELIEEIIDGLETG